MVKTPVICYDEYFHKTFSVFDIFLIINSLLYLTPFVFTTHQLYNMFIIRRLAKTDSIPS